MFRCAIRNLHSLFLILHSYYDQSLSVYPSRSKIGENVEIAPFVFIDKNVVIGDNNKIMANANIMYGSRIGNGNTISQEP